MRLGPLGYSGAKELDLDFQTPIPPPKKMMSEYVPETDARPFPVQ